MPKQFTTGGGLSAPDFFRELNELVHAGMSVAEGLSILEETELSTMVREGNPLWQALQRTKKYPYAYLKYWEEADQLTYGLELSYDHLQRQEEMRKRMAKSLTTPIFLFVMFFSILMLLTVKFLPIFNYAYNLIGTDAPSINSAVIWLTFGVVGFLYFMYYRNIYNTFKKEVHIADLAEERAIMLAQGEEVSSDISMFPVYYQHILEIARKGDYLQRSYNWACVKMGDAAYEKMEHSIDNMERWAILILGLVISVLLLSVLMPMVGAI